MARVIPATLAQRTLFKQSEISILLNIGVDISARTYKAQLKTADKTTLIGDFTIVQDNNAKTVLLTMSPTYLTEVSTNKEYKFDIAYTVGSAAPVYRFEGSIFFKEGVTEYA